MTAKEKASELVDQFFGICNCTIAGTGTIFKDIAKQCAAASIDRVIAELQDLEIGYDADFNIEISWQRKIKTEIEKL